MANYSIQRSDLATGNITVTEASVNATTNVTLIGQNFTGYGDEIATNFLQMLENFATDVDPTTNPRVVGSVIRGQLWYDTTGTGTLKIYNGASYDELAKVSDGTTESSTLRWNNTAGRYQAEERVRVSDAGSLLIDAAAAGTNAVTFNHDGTDLIISSAGTTDITFSGLSGDLTVTGGRGLSVENGAGAFAIRHDGTNANITHASTTNLIIAGAGLVTAASIAGRAGFNIPTGTAPSAPAQGDMWVEATDAFIRINGVNESILTTGAAVSTLDDLTDVTAAGTTNAMLYKSAGDWIEAPGMTYNGSNFVATNIAGIASGDLVDKSAGETIAGAWIFSNATPIVASAGDISATGGNGFTSTDGSTAIGIRAETGGNTIDFTHSNTPDWHITGLGQVLVDGAEVFVDNVNGEGLRLQGTFTSSSLQTYINFRDSANTIKASVGIKSGSNDLVIDGGSDGVDVKGTDGNDKIVVNNGVQLVGTGTESAFGTAVVGSSFKTSRGTIYNDINTGSGGYSIGYNETPQANGGALAAGGTYNVSIDDIGLFLTRTTSSATIIDFGPVTSAPTGATVLVHNDNTGTCTISVSGGMGLEWIDGSGGIAPSGNRTLARNSICTLRKKSGGLWQIWGNGIS